MRDYSADKTKARIRFLLLLIFLLLSLIVYRLIFIQVVEAKKFSKMAFSERVSEIDIPAFRGTIYDRSGNELAVSVEAETIYATPYLVKNPRKTASSLSEVLGIDKEILYKKLTKKCGFVYLARKVDKEVGKRIKKLKIEGVGSFKESKRYYPFGSLASHVIGFSGTDNNGLSGIELYYDDVLKGKPGRLIVEKDPQGRYIPGGIYKLYPPKNGKDIVLTIDKEIQHKAEEELKKGVEEFKAKAGTVIVMNPKNGEIYAMANFPTFDLNHFSSAEKNALRNRAVTDVFEPGSTMKIVTATAALEENICDVNSCFYLPSSIRIGGKSVSDAHERGAKNFTFADIVVESSNVGAVTLGLKLGKETLYKYITAFGLTGKTGIDLPGEATGYTPPPNLWWATSIGNIPFGQGLSATSLQMLQVTSIVANDGFKVTPHLVKKVEDGKGKFKFAEEKIISAKTCRKMREILTKVVEEGTGTKAQIPGYKVAGKTGTAQKPGKGGYNTGKYVASFIGFAPADDPAVAVLVMIDEPQEAIYGGEVAAPIFKNVMEFSLQRLRVPPGGLSD